MMILALILSSILVQETRAWEKVMGLPKTEIIFSDEMSLCGELRMVPMLGSRFMELEPVIYYSTKRECAGSWTPKELALHELCHLRMAHPETGIKGHRAENEARQCASWYRGRR